MPDPASAPKAPERCSTLEQVREGIDLLDRQIISLLSRRSDYVIAAARFKTSERR